MKKKVMILNIVHSESHRRAKMSKSVQITMKTSKGSRDSDVLTDIPGKTNLAECTVELSDDIPFRVKAYPVP